MCSLQQKIDDPANLLNTPTIGNENIAQMYIDTDSQKLMQVKAVIIIIRLHQWNKTTVFQL